MEFWEREGSIGKREKGLGDRFMGWKGGWFAWALFEVSE